MQALQWAAVALFAAALLRRSRLFVSSGFVAGTGSGQDVRQAVVAFVARVFEDSVWRVLRAPRHRERPRSCVLRRILDREPGVDGVRVYARIPLDHARVRTAVPGPL